MVIIDIHASLARQCATFFVEHNGRSVSFPAKRGARASFFVVSSIPGCGVGVENEIVQDLALRGFDSKGAPRYVQLMTLAELTTPGGIQRNRLALMASAAVLNNPLEQLRKDRTMVLSASERYVIPPVDLQCTRKNVQGIPVQSRLRGPYNLLATMMERPQERSRSHPRRIMRREGNGHSNGNGNRKASHGRMSLLQASVIKAEHHIPPISLSLSTIPQDTPDTENEEYEEEEDDEEIVFDQEEVVPLLPNDFLLPSLQEILSLCTGDDFLDEMELLSNACRKLRVSNENRARLIEDGDTLPLEMI